MASVPVPFYYNQFSTKERSYIEYMGELSKNTGSTIESAAKEISSSIIDAQIATSKAIYNNTQELKGTLTAGFSGVSNQLQSGFSDVSRELGAMGSSMNMRFALLNSAVQESSRTICNKLDSINNTLQNPLYTESRELYNRAALNYNKGLYEETLEDLKEAIKKNKVDPSSHFLMGQTYLRGISEFSNVINLDASIEALKNAAKYITSDAQTYPEVRSLASEIWFTLGLAYHAKANDSLHNSNETDYRKILEEAKTAYGKSWDYSQNMLESLYNLSRCKALFNETNGAVQDLITLILKDHGYCIKAFLESDFDDELKNKLYNRLKGELYSKVKSVFDSIQSVKADFKASYTSELKRLINIHLPDTFTEDTPPFDMLKASVYFPKILTSLEMEKEDYEQKRNEAERLRLEAERKREADERQCREDEANRVKIRAEMKEREILKNRRAVFLSVPAFFFALLPIIIALINYRGNAFLVGTIIAIVPFLVSFFPTSRVGAMFLFYGIIGNILAIIVGLTSYKYVLVVMCVSNIISYILITILKKEQYFGEKEYYVFGEYQKKKDALKKIISLFLSVSANCFALLPIILANGWGKFGAIIAIVPFMVLFFLTDAADYSPVGTTFMVLGIIGNIIALIVGLASGRIELLVMCVSNIISYILVNIMRKRDLRLTFLANM